MDCRRASGRHDIWRRARQAQPSPNLQDFMSGMEDLWGATMKLGPNLQTVPHHQNAPAGFHESARGGVVTLQDQRTRESVGFCGLSATRQRNQNAGLRIFPCAGLGHVERGTGPRSNAGASFRFCECPVSSFLRFNCGCAQLAWLALHDLIQSGPNLLERLGFYRLLSMSFYIAGGSVPVLATHPQFARSILATVSEG
jgi:hypothetical protein